MVVKRKAIFKKAAKQLDYQKKFLNLKARLDASKPRRPGNGMINLDPREWNGGFDQQPPARQFEDGYKRAVMPQNPYADVMRNKLQAAFQHQREQFQKPQPGLGDGMIQLDPREWNGGFDDNALQGLNNGFNNAMNQGKEQFERALQNQPHVPGEVRGQGQEVGAMQPRPQGAYQGQPRPQPGNGQRVGATAQQLRSASLTRDDFLSTNADGSRMNVDQFTDKYYPNQMKSSGGSGAQTDAYLYNWNHYNNVTHNPNMIGREEPWEIAQREAAQREAQPVSSGMVDKFAGGLPQLPQLPGPARMELNKVMNKLRPTQPGRGGIQLDPRESGGFNRPQTPVKMPMMPGGGMPGGGQRPVPLPSPIRRQMPPITRPRPGIGMPQQPVRF